MASYIQININTANAPHFAMWYHNRSGQAMSYLTAAVLNYAITQQFLLIGYAPKDISLEELPKVFQIRIKGNESIVKWESDLKRVNLNKRRTIEYLSLIHIYWYALVCRAFLSTGTNALVL